MVELIDEFLDQTPKQVRKLSRALRDGNEQELERAALSLRAAAENLGALRLARLVDELEERAGDDQSSSDSLVKPLNGELERVRYALQSERGSLLDG